jgi:hypothetical protein
MKSERRHELQQNSLIRGVQNLPSFWRESGSKISLAIIAVLLVFVLVRLWYTNRNDKAARLAADLTDAQSKLTDLKRSTELWLTQSIPPEKFNEQRKAIQGSILTATDDVLKNSSDQAQQADAKVIRADLNYFLGQMGAMPEATTRPEFQLDKKQSELLEAAAQDYAAVAGQAAGLPPALVARAHFGLAAIAEDQDRPDWPKARAEYEAVAKTPGAPEAMIDLANRRIELLSKIEVPVLLGEPRPTPATRPSPSTTPATSPGTQPATGPTTLPLGPVLGPVPGPVPAPATQSAATQPAGTQPTAPAAPATRP